MSTNLDQTINNIGNILVVAWPTIVLVTLLIKAAVDQHKFGFFKLMGFILLQIAWIWILNHFLKNYVGEVVNVF